MTDGRQRVFGMEYRPLPGISWDCPAGCKVGHDCAVAHGRFVAAILYCRGWTWHASNTQQQHNWTDRVAASDA